MSVDITKGATVELVKTLSDDIRTETAGGTPTAGVSAGDVVRKKASPDGNYPNMTAGTANAVLSDNYTEESVPYLFRKTGADSTRAEDMIVGGTVAWNQLMTTYGSRTDNGITMTPTQNVGEYALTGTPATANNSFGMAVANSENHIYLFFANTNINGLLFGNQVTGTRNYDGSMWKSSVSTTVRYWVVKFDSSIVGQSVSGTFRPQVFDLTQMFGTEVADAIYAMQTASAGSGVAFFKSLFPKDYYEYNAGELISVAGLQSKVTTGFNQWDEEWENGEPNTNTGNYEVNANRIVSKNFIPIIPSAEYYFRTATSASAYVFFYDENYTYIGFYGTYVTNRTFTPSALSNAKSGGGSFANARYMKFRFNNATYNNDICINLSDPAKNGTYEPYKSNSYPLDSSITLRGVPKLVNGQIQFDGDTYESDGTVTRKYGIVDLGTLTWTYLNDGVFKTPKINGMIFGYLPKWLCSVYSIGTTTNYTGWKQRNNQIGYLEGGTFVIAMNTAYTDAATFESAMSGVYLVYELATPTTETADSYINPQIVSKYGTEEYVCETEADVLCPVGHVTKYYEDVAGKVAGLPSDFSTLIAPTETAMTATRAYTVNQFLIVNNQLYKVTANIANGGTITVGTNVTAVTISDILTALLSA